MKKKFLVVLLLASLVMASAFAVEKNAVLKYVITEPDFAAAFFTSININEQLQTEMTEFNVGENEKVFGTGSFEFALMDNTFYNGTTPKTWRLAIHGGNWMNGATDTGIFVTPVFSAVSVEGSTQQVVEGKLHITYPGTAVVARDGVGMAAKVATVGTSWDTTTELIAGNYTATLRIEILADV